MGATGRLEAARRRPGGRQGTALTGGRLHGSHWTPRGRQEAPRAPDGHRAQEGTAAAASYRRTAPRRLTAPLSRPIGGTRTLAGLHGQRPCHRPLPQDERAAAACTCAYIIKYPAPTPFLCTTVPDLGADWGHPGPPNKGGTPG
jgi:hypothetical protein